MGTLEIEQKSMLSNATDGGLFLRIQKENSDDIKKKKLLGRKLDIKIIIKY